LIPQASINKYLQHVGERAWTDAEKELDTIKQKSDSTQWSRGYVKALEGLMLTYRNEDDRYIYLPRALGNKNGQETEALKKEFAEFAANEIHGEYDRGFFKALEDYLSLAGNQRASQEQPQPKSSDTVQQKLTNDQKE
jgi:hypothetical protein